MSTPTGAICPNGHVSGDPEWCDTCGAPMHGPGAGVGGAVQEPGSRSLAGAGSGPGLAIAPVSCPHCGAVNAADNLFCESCGYDFTTGQAPEPSVPLAQPVVTAVVDPLEPGSLEPGSLEPGSLGSGPLESGSLPGEAARVVPTGATPSVIWVVIVEVDPAWYALKGELADRPLPSPSTSTVPLQQHASMIGRTSQSRGVRPEVALDTDTAVSRRHAQLVLEGDLLSVVDLSSTNGTYVLGRGQVPADDGVPLASGVPAVLDDGDQIFVGAWSRLTVRRA